MKNKGTNIIMSWEINLDIKTKLTDIERMNLILDLKNQINDLIELKISDIGMAHQKLIDGVNLTINNKF